MITNGRYKYVFNAPEIDEFYDLGSDPWEMQNLIAEDSYRGRIAHMRARLIDWLQRSQDPLAGWISNLFAERARTRPEDYTTYRD
jgi:hypothetical protein